MLLIVSLVVMALMLGAGPVLVLFFVARALIVYALNGPRRRSGPKTS